MKLWATLIFAAQVRCQDPPDTTKPSETTTTAAALPTTTPEPVIKCVVCEANSTIGENMDCFDGIGEEKDFTKDGACSYTYSRVEKDGQSVYTVKRGGTKDRGDAADYPRKNAEDQWEQICTDSSCNDRNAKEWFGVSDFVRAVRYFFGDDETTTKAVTTTTVMTTTPTAPPNFSCYSCAGESSSGNYTDLADCGTLDDNTASMIVCGAEDISSCITQFKKSSDAVAGINSMEVARDCNAKDNSQKPSESSSTNIEYYCIDSLCNNDKLDSSSMIVTINLIVLFFALCQ